MTMPVQTQSRGRNTGGVYLNTRGIAPLLRLAVCNMWTLPLARPQHLRTAQPTMDSSDYRDYVCPIMNSRSYLQERSAASHRAGSRERSHITYRQQEERSDTASVQIYAPRITPSGWWFWEWTDTTDISIRKIVVYKNQRFLMRDYEMAGMSYITEMLKSQRLWWYSPFFWWWK